MAAFVINKFSAQLSVYLLFWPRLFETSRSTLFAFFTFYQRPAEPHIKLKLPFFEASEFR